MAPDNQPERDPIEAAYMAKIAAWTAALETYRAAKALDGGTVDVPTLGSGAGRPMELPVGVFRDKGVKEAIPIYLEAARRKQTNKEIAAGLLRGGIATTSDNFEATVATALLRLKNDGVLLRFPDGWDLAASYPESLRGRLEKDDAPKKPKAKVKNGRKRTARNAAKVAVKAVKKESTETPKPKPVGQARPRAIHLRAEEDAAAS